MESYGLIVGIDVSKDWVDVSYRKGKVSFYLGRYDNEGPGFDKMLLALSDITESERETWFFCFENTGSYSKVLCKYLFGKGCPYLEECPSRISGHLRLKRGKDDKSDSMGICDYAYLHREELTPSVPADANCVRIKHLLSKRALLVKQKVSLLQDRKVARTGLNEDDIASVKEVTEELLSIYRAGIRKINRMIASIIKEDDSLKENERLVRTVTGVGPVTAAYVLAFTDNFRRFGMNARKFACYCGIAPFPNRSGKHKGRDRVSQRGNRTIKAILANAAISAITHDAQLKSYYDRMTKRGKPPGSIYNAIKNKLVARIFAVVKRRTDFVDVFAYK